MENDKKWGNIELPGLSDDILLSPNLNKILANRAKAKDPTYNLRRSNKLLGRKFAPTTLDKMSSSAANRTASDTTKKKISKSLMGRPVSENTRRKLSVANSNMTLEQREKLSKIAKKRPPRTKEQREKLSKSCKGIAKPKSAEHLKNWSESAKKRPRLTCNHCGKIGEKNSMMRWHFDNCKKKPK